MKPMQGIRTREGKTSTSQLHQEEDLEILGLKSKPRTQKKKRKWNTKRQQNKQPIAKTAAKNN